MFLNQRSQQLMKAGKDVSCRLIVQRSPDKKELLLLQLSKEISNLKRKVGKLKQIENSSFLHKL